MFYERLIENIRVIIRYRDSVFIVIVSIECVHVCANNITPLMYSTTAGFPILRKLSYRNVVFVYGAFEYFINTRKLVEVIYLPIPSIWECFNRRMASRLKRNIRDLQSRFAGFDNWPILIIYSFNVILNVAVRPMTCTACCCYVSFRV